MTDIPHLEAILDELATSIHNLSPGDVGSMDRVLYPIAKAKAAILSTHVPKAEVERLVVVAERQGRYVTASLLLHHVGYLLAHRAEGTLPEMTAQVIGELYEELKAITETNEPYMRTATLKKPEERSE